MTINNNYHVSWCAIITSYPFSPFLEVIVTRTKKKPENIVIVHFLPTVSKTFWRDIIWLHIMSETGIKANLPNERQMQNYITKRQCDNEQITRKLSQKE